MKLITKRSLLTMLAVPAMVLGIVTVGLPTYAATDPACTGSTDLSLSNAANCAKTKDQSTSLFGSGGVFETVSKVLLFIIGAVSVIMLIIGGIRYTISQGDSSAITSAKNTILYAIVGLVVAILAYAAVSFIIQSFTAKDDTAAYFTTASRS